MITEKIQLIEKYCSLQNNGFKSNIPYIDAGVNDIPLFSKIPHDYLKFLQNVSNGFVLNDIYLFGTCSFKHPKSLQIIDCLFDANTRSIDSGHCGGMLVIGGSATKCFAFNPDLSRQRPYVIIENDGTDKSYCKTFEEFFLRTFSLADIKVDALRVNGFNPLVGEVADYMDIIGVLAYFHETCVPLIPDDYQNFLMDTANGFAWNGAEFYGTTSVNAPDSNYSMDDIIDINLKWMDYPEFKGKLVVGSCDDDIFVYNSVDNVYEVVDRSGKDALVTYALFDELFINEL